MYQVLSCGFFILSFSWLISSGQAQIVPDVTLPVNSIVTPQENISVIERGTQTGSNLFHSFREFSIPTGTEVFFNNNLDIQNIFSRVTGSNISNIDGLIRVNGTANLFLINPNGMIFGQNARLNIGGSFLASTASSIRFADGIEFSAINPNTAALLTINTPIGLQFAANSPNPNASIIVQGAGNNLRAVPITTAIIRDDRPIGLAVSSNQTLALVGGDVNLVGGNLTAPFGRIELGSVASGSTVSLTSTNLGWQLGYEGVQNFRDISLSQAASVDTSGSGGGSIQLSGRRISLTDGSAILSLVQGSNSGGNLRVNASELLEITGSSNVQFTSRLSIDVQEKATSNGGDLIVETERLILKDGAGISTATFGSGKGGNLSIKASDAIELIGTFDNSLPTALYTTVLLPNSTGNGGNLIVETRRLTLKDGAAILTSTSGEGKAGNMTIKAADVIELIGSSANGKATNGLITSAFPNSTGDGGNLTIETGRLILKNGSFIASSTLAQGKAGNISIKANDAIEINGKSADGVPPSAVSASANLNSTGDGGNLTIETGRLTLKDGAGIATSTSGKGKAGNITIKANDVVELLGVSANSKAISVLSTSANLNSTGDGGNLTIETGRLTIKDVAAITTSTSGKGKAGNITIKAKDAVELLGRSADGLFISAMSASANPKSTGDGGNLTIETGQLSVKDGATLRVRSRGEGKAGTLRVFADSIELSNQASLDASTKTGGGSIELQAPIIALRDSSITTNATGGDSGGDINLVSQLLQLRDGSAIATNASGNNAKGGNITINTDILAALANSDISANSLDSSGGAVIINAQAIFGAKSLTREQLQTLLNTEDSNLLDPRLVPSSDITATGANSALSGTITINTVDVDRSSGLVDLPDNIVDATALVASTCRRGPESNQFIVTGRGGLPLSPYDALNEDATWMDLRITTAQTPPNQVTNSTASAITSGKEIVEAQGWMINSEGEVILIAETPKATLDNSGFSPSQCHDL